MPMTLKQSLIEMTGYLDGGVRGTFLQRINIVNEQWRSTVHKEYAPA